MASISYTSEQRIAIDTKDKNIIVSAQAGAGKTQVLVERIIDKVKNEKVDIENLLIVTFTNKAAQEMKDRIKSSLQTAASDSKDERRYLNEQFNKVTNAQISTMHSFCINSLRTFFHKIDLNPQFKILNQATLNILRWEVMDEVFHEFYEKKDHDFIELLNEYSDLKNDEALKSNLFRIYDFIMSQIDPFGWLGEARDKYLNPDFNNNEDFYEYKKQQLFDTASSSLGEMISRSQKKAEAVEKFYSMGTLTEKHGLVVEETLGITRQINSLFESKNYEHIKELLDNFEFMRMVSIPKKLKESDPYIGDEHKKFKVIRDVFKESIIDIKGVMDELDVDELIYIETKNYEYISTIYNILERFHQKFLEIKKAKDGIDFSDTEHLMVKLLEDKDVRDSLRDRFEYIFFDEYQDANQIQNHIVEMIKRKDNLFFVGDIKQSIYKFRLADPSIFNRRYNDYKSGANEEDLAVDLTANFRSRREILEFSNYIFDSLMTMELGDIDYDDPAHRLLARGSFEPLEEYTPVEFNYINNEIEKEFKKDEEYVENSEYYEQNAQAYLIAKKLEAMIEKGHRPKDFAILLRNKQMIPDICEYLQTLDIPYYTDSIDFNYDNLEVLEFINILKAIDNDKMDLVLLSALVSVIGRFSEDEIAKIRNEAGDESFYKSFYNYVNKENAEKEIVVKINDYSKRLDRYRKNERTMSLYEFSWYLLIDSGYMTYLLTKNSGKEKLDNVMAFIEEIGNYEENANPGLYNFLNYVDRLSNRDLSSIEPGAELSDEDDVVRIMTIHKSKGLQFKNVILGNMDKNFNLKDISSYFILNNEEGMALRLYDESIMKYKSNLFYDKIANIIKRELLSEEIRLQYVALTRAIDRLIVVGNVKNKTFKSISDDFIDEKNPLSWLNSIVLKDEVSKDFKIVNVIDYETTSTRLKDLGVNIEFNIYQQSEIVEKMKEASTPSTNIEINDEQSLEQMKYFNATYDFQEQTTIPFKKTVSELSNYNDNKSPEFKRYENIIETELLLPKEEKDSTDIEPREDNEIRMPNGFEVPDFLNQELTATDKGTITHHVLQMLPIRAYDKESLKNELDRQVLIGTLRTDDIELVDLDSIIYLYNSDIGKRILNADKVYKEESFTMIYNDEGNNILVDGQVDLFFIENGGIVLIDFKTNRRIDNDLYTRQFELYTMGIEKALKIPVKERYIYWTRFNKFTKM
ncbi:MAG: helicase-exonuclease AddAB subunit AddA [Tissierellia bacterium]|nr:helicase-exonuclease AddAB subunit AddA [Tissierellia bacterium]